MPSAGLGMPPMPPAPSVLLNPKPGLGLGMGSPPPGPPLNAVTGATGVGPLAPAPAFVSAGGIASFEGEQNRNLALLLQKDL